MVKDAPFVFSVSHSGRWVAMAVSAGSSRALGLDIEVTGNLPDVDALASTVLSRTELATYGSLTVDARQAWIHRMWTRKEAALKAYGDGLSIDPQSVDVGGPTTVVPPAVGEVGGKVVGEVGGDHRAAGAVAERRLHLRDVDVWDGYAAAIATGPDPVARLWSYVVTPDFPTRPR